MSTGYRWARPGDVNAFFGLAVDNFTQLVILSSILVGAYGFPADIVLLKMVPGTAMGVMIGDLIYTYMAFRLAKKSGRDDVCAMPLGIDTPGLFGVTFGVVGPVYLDTKDATLAWQVGMSVTVVMGATKILFSFFGHWVRSNVPRASLLGSIAAVAILLIAFIPTLKIMSDPVVGFVSMGIIFLTFLAKYRLPYNLPGALVAILLATGTFSVLSLFGLVPAGHPAAGLEEFHLSLPIPTLGFLDGFVYSLKYLPIAIPFAITAVVGGIDCTESAAAAGDEYDTRNILLTQGVGTLMAGLCGGVLQNTPYIGHPAYKRMGGRAAYTLSLGLLIGLGSIFGVIPYFVNLVPEAAVAPILIFIGLEITSQAFHANPERHYVAVSLAFIPVIGFLLFLYMNNLIHAAGISVENLPPDLKATYFGSMVLGNGFILSAMLWSGMLALLIDNRLHLAGLYMILGGIMTLFGLIHSTFPDGRLFLPWQSPSPMTFHIFFAYLSLALIFYIISYIHMDREK